MNRIKRWLKIAAGVLVALIAVGLLGNAIAVWHFGGKFEKQIDALRAAGHPVTLSELERPAIPAEENAATYIDRANSDMEALEKEIYSPELQAQTDWFTPENLDRYAKIRDQYPRVLPLIAQATQKSKLDLGLDFTLPPSQFVAPLLEKQQAFRSAARILQWEALWLASKGKTDEAIVTGLRIIKLGHELQANAVMVVNYLVGLAISSVGIDTVHQILAKASDLSPHARQDIETVLHAHASSASFQRMLAKERAFGLASYQEMIERTWLPRAYFYDDANGYLDLFAEFIALAPRPYEQCKEELPVHQPSRKRLALANLTIPSLLATLQARYRHEALSHCLLVQNEIQKQSSSGDASSITLDALPLAPEDKVDPYTGKLLLLKKSPDEWTVYSLGQNLADDEGDIARLADVGLRFPAPKPRK